MVKRTRSILDAQNESVKRPRYATGNETLSADGIISMLRTQDVGSLRQGMTSVSKKNFYVSCLTARRTHKTEKQLRF